MIAFESRPNLAGQPFPGLAQRMVYGLLGTFPGFVAVPSDIADERSQRQMHEFLWAAAVRIFEEPAVLDLPTLPDEAYEFWEVNNRKPELIKAMRSILKTIDGFYELLLKIGTAGELMAGGIHLGKETLKLGPRQLALLRRFGIESSTSNDGVELRCEGWEDIFPAWKLLSGIAATTANPTGTFARGIFDPAHSHGDGVFGFLTGNPALFAELAAFLRERGYTRTETLSESGSRIEWRKALSAKEELFVGMWYDYRKKYPFFLETKVSRFRELVHRFADMGEGLQAHVIERTKKCDGCGYCVQTNREKLKPVTVSVEHGGTAYAVCPFFPYLTWHHLDGRALSIQKELLLFAEEQLTAR